MEIVAQGAEAILHKDGQNIIKSRISKSYRHPEIDNTLRNSRTKREAKILEKLSIIGIPAPKRIKTDEKDATITMTLLNGPKLRDTIQENPKAYASEIGKIIGKLHANNIIHGDLTTSNMMLSNGKIHLIDFGLSFFSHKPEDKATDLKLLQRALESKHHEIAQECFETALESYSDTYPDADAILNQLGKVQLRGRNKRQQNN